jgi:hypothetical protein
MANISPETRMNESTVYSTVRSICRSTDANSWLGLYWYARDASHPPDWEVAAIIRAMNDCTAQQ